MQGEDQTGVSPAVDIEGPDRLSLKEGDSVQLTCTATGICTLNKVYVYQVHLPSLTVCTGKINLLPEDCG